MGSRLWAGVGTMAIVAALATRAPAEPPRRLVISDVAIIPMDAAGHGPRATVVIEDGIITRIADSSERIWSRGDELIRGTGLWLMPGLIDGQVCTHDPADLHAMVLAGTTSVVLDDDEGGAAWLAPLVAHAPTGLPHLLRPPADRQLPEPSGCARSTAVSRWKGSDDPDGCLDLVDPAVASRWVAHSEDAAKSIERPGAVPPSSAALLPGSFAGQPFMAPDRALVDELMALADQGRAAGECLHAATLGAAELLGEPRRGRVAEGAVADLLLLEADPREDLGALRRIRAVILRGQVIRAARRESTLDLLRELRRDQRRWLESAASAAPQAGVGDRAQPLGTRRRWLIRFDGMPRGIRETEFPCQPGGATIDRRVLWPPFRSTLEVVDRRSNSERRASLEVAFRSPAGNLAATLAPTSTAWELEVLDPDAPAADPVSPLQLAPESADPLLIADFWPSSADLVRLWRDRDSARPAWELVFGAGPVTLAPRLVDLEPWSPEGGRQTGHEAARRAEHSGIHSRRGVEALAVSIANGPWRPATVRVLRIGELAPRAGGPRFGLTGLGPWTDQALVVGAIGFDDQGLPLVGRISVPEGVWDFHPLAELPALSTTPSPIPSPNPSSKSPSSSSPGRGGSTSPGTTEAPPASDQGPARRSGGPQEAVSEYPCSSTAPPSSASRSASD